MAAKAGGGSRFKGAGSLWKTLWKGRVPFSQFCCIEGFGADADGQFYENTNGPLPIVPANGFFLGAALGISQPPVGNDPIIRNGGNANEGWEIVMSDLTVDPGSPSVGFTFTVFGGTGPVASVTDQVSLRNVGGLDGFIPRLTVLLMVGFAVPSGAAPNGRIGIRLAGRPFDSQDSLTAPYVNDDPYLAVGERAPEAFAPPNCIVGFVGGEANFDASGVFSSQLVTLLSAWADATVNAQRVVEAPSVVTTPALVVTNQHGWQAPQSGPGIAPNQLPDFVNSEPLVYGAPQPPASDLDIDCYSPIVTPPANTSFPFE